NTQPGVLYVMNGLARIPSEQAVIHSRSIPPPHAIQSFPHAYAPSSRNPSGSLRNPRAHRRGWKGRCALSLFHRSELSPVKILSLAAILTGNGRLTEAQLLRTPSAVSFTAVVWLGMLASAFAQSAFADLRMTSARRANCASAS